MTRLRLTLVTAAALLACLAVPAAQAPKLDLSEKALVELASKYVAEYEKQFAFLIADEVYLQKQSDAGGRVMRERRLKSELFLTYLPVDGEWIAVRDVIEVDGLPVAGREDLRALLAKREELRGLTGKLVDRNAQYNIGSVTRNFNEPTLPLLLLERKRIGRVSFDRKRVTEENGITLATLGFEERDRPTLVAAPEGPVRSKGEIVIDAATGAVHRTVFELKQKGTDVRLETLYAKDEKLDLWLPSVFQERYDSKNTTGYVTGTRSVTSSHRERIDCEARYTNYRRFEVTARIK